MAFSLFSKNKTEKKQTGKWSPDLQALHLDLFCHLTYMAAISTSGISREGLFRYSSSLPLQSNHYFKKINVVAKAFNHDYAESCRIVGDSVKELDAKALLLRLGGALSSGEDISNFLEKEAEVASEKYCNRYEGCLESLKKWTDAYVALIMTSAIVVVMTVVTLIIGSGSAAFILGFGTLTVLITIAGVWLIYSSAPREDKTHSLPVRSRNMNMANFFFRFSMPLGIVLAIASIIAHMPLGVSLLIASVLFLPLGFAAIMDDGKISKYEGDIGGFLRSLGGVAQATNITINEALGRLDFRSMVSLKESANLLYTRVQAGLEARLCWDRLVAETGSELVVRSTTIFLDSIAIGGEAERVGREASTFALKIALLRIKRSTVASGFLWLAGIMHIVLVSLVLFIFETMGQFGTLVQNILPGGADASVGGAPMFGIYSAGSSQMSMLQFMVIGVIMVLTVANAIAVYATAGGHYYKIFFYLGITLGISGTVMLLVPKIVEMMFRLMA
jgi:flagellar protein FlaJ